MKSKFEALDLQKENLKDEKMKDVSFIMKDGELTVVMLPEIDHHTAKIIREAADACIEKERPKRIILDFSPVTFMDSSGLGLILGRVKKAEEKSAVVTVRGLSPKLNKLLRMSGIEKIKSLTLV